MKHKGGLPAQERKVRSRLAKLVHREPYLQGSLVDSTFKCGKDNCWCTKANKGHAACYLSMRVGTKRKMIYVPKSYEKQAREWVKTYRQINKGIATVSKHCLNRLKQR